MDQSSNTPLNNLTEADRLIPFLLPPIESIVYGYLSIEQLLEYASKDNVPEFINAALAEIVMLLKRKKVRLIVEPDLYTTLSKTIGDFKRELNELLKNKRVMDQEKEALKLADFSSEGTSIESLIALDELLEKTNLKIMEDVKGKGFPSFNIDLNISISGLSVTRIPAKFIDIIKDKKYFHILDLSNNALTYLPDEIGSLKPLQFLNLSKNKLSKLPDSFFNLTSLWVLLASNNQLSELSGNIHHLKKLYHLTLKQNNLSTLPSELSELTKLEHFEIEENPFTSFPEPLRKLLTRHYPHSLLKLIQPESDSKNAPVSDVTTNPNSNSGTVTEQPKAPPFIPYFARLNISSSSKEQKQDKPKIKATAILHLPSLVG